MNRKLVASAFRYFQKGITSHLHNTRKLLLHELEEFLNDGFQECPVIAQEGGILADYVHYTGGDYGFVVFALLGLAQLE